jgi:hypothetical protein
VWRIPYVRNLGFRDRVTRVVSIIISFPLVPALLWFLKGCHALFFFSIFLIKLSHAVCWCMCIEIQNNPVCQICTPLKFSCLPCPFTRLHISSVPRLLFGSVGFDVTSHRITAVCPILDRSIVIRLVSTIISFPLVPPEPLHCFLNGGCASTLTNGSHPRTAVWQNPCQSSKQPPRSTLRSLGGARKAAPTCTNLPFYMSMYPNIAEWASAL